MLSRSVFLVLVVSATAPITYASVIVNTSLNLTRFTITATTGSVEIGPGISGTEFSAAADDLGDLDQEFNSGTDSASSTSAAVPLATASGSSNGSLLTAGAASGVAIPSLNAAILPSSTDGNAELSGSFEIVDSTDPSSTPVSVSFTAVLGGTQYLFTNSVGISADSETTFQLSLPENDSSGNPLTQPFLFYDNPLTIGSGASSSTTINRTLNSSASLLTNTPYSFFLEVDAESDGFDAQAPEPISFLMMGGGLALLLTVRQIHRG